MSKTIVNFIILFVVLVAAQAVFFNNIVLMGVAIPLVFIYLIISMPVTWSTNWSITVGFLLGLTIDIMSDTQGINALGCTILSFVRKPIFHLYTSFDDDLAGVRPSLRSMGTSAYLKYMLSMVVLYCAMVFVFEAFQIFNIKLLLMRIFASAIYTFFIIYAIAFLSYSRREKKL